MWRKIMENQKENAESVLTSNGNARDDLARDDLALS